MRVSFTATKALGALTVALVLLSAPEAKAVGEPEASPTGKGITGGALLGGEIVMMTEAALGVRPAWAYIVGGVAGAAGGGVGGFFIEDSAAPRISFIMLTAGMALAIPTSIAIMAATAYEPPEDVIRDTGPADEPVADPASVSSRRSPRDRSPRDEASALKHNRLAKRSKRSAQRAARALALPPALVDLEPGRLTLNLPALEVSDVFTPLEQQMWGVSQRTQLKLPVFSYVF